jgi:hypothetical protein
MESDSVSRQQSPMTPPLSPSLPGAAGSFASEEFAAEESGESDERGAMSTALTRLSFCVAWLFGLEAFLSEPDDRSRAPRG